MNYYRFWSQKEQNFVEVPMGRQARRNFPFWHAKMEVKVGGRRPPSLQNDRANWEWQNSLLPIVYENTRFVEGGMTPPLPAVINGNYVWRQGHWPWQGHEGRTAGPRGRLP
jgi:hypothetical protein